jgi:UDP-2,3-diacylglucosamine pyrophosphatase LpxH
MTAGAHERVVVVSDLHLDSAPPAVSSASWRYDAALAALCRRVRRSRGPFRLVLLGDLLELPHADAGTTADAAEQVLEAHPLVTGALAEHLAHDGVVDVVSGNHDIGLAHPRVQSRLRAGLEAGGASGDRLRFSPWLLHLPGVLYAEHGCQYHDINASPRVLRPVAADGRVDRSPGSLLARVRSGPGGVSASAGLLASLVGRCLPGADRGRQRYRAEVLPSCARSSGLPLGALEELDELSARTVARLPLRAAAEATTRVRRRAPAGSYLSTAAQDVHRILDRHGAAVPFYVFGHTHQATDVPLRGQRPARMLNTGTWSADIRPPRHGLRLPDPTWVEITARPGTRAQGRVRSFPLDSAVLAGAW